MVYHWDFLKEKDSSFGMFFPKHYVVVGFENQERATTAVDRFREAGFAEDDVAAVSGTFMTQTLEAEPDTTLQKLKVAIAEMHGGTEHGYVDDDIKLARRGGAFAFVYTPDDASAERARQVLDGVDHVYARRYLPMAIERYKYPSQSQI
ncbi:hypothetical protein [Coralloluteibacterium stylophorae]|uniref:Uncharacterized protein n=1 Tax=Coralloluteibacterium stylophorae TaxID=1776034 RepID=A0A8J7VXL3_9GAMM|nr:hypothetical protein [Coralloluteibacterium stylophorae]MBS7456465.1 hypothetical protein [Coralloluteibacterium stylophorae]